MSGTDVSPSQTWPNSKVRPRHGRTAKEKDGRLPWNGSRGSSCQARRSWYPHKLFQCCMLHAERADRYHSTTLWRCWALESRRPRVRLYLQKGFTAGRSMSRVSIGLGIANAWHEGWGGTLS
eukprot:3941930-Rhodomonas_salina.11